MGSSYRRAAPPRVAHDSAKFAEMISCCNPNLPTKDSCPLPKIVGTLCIDLLSSIRSALDIALKTPSVCPHSSVAGTKC